MAFSSQFESLRSKVHFDTLKDNFNELRVSIETFAQSIPSEFDKYVTTLKNTSPHELVDDLSHFKLNAATATVSVATLATIILVSRLIPTKSAPTANQKKNKKKKKLLKAQKANLEIQLILDYVEEKYVPDIDSYLENHASLPADQVQYKYTYFEEMLLKELMKLDGVDVSANDVLRENRKKVIKFIQDHQKRLDKLKAELKLN